MSFVLELSLETGSRSRGVLQLPARVWWHLMLLLRSEWAWVHLGARDNAIRDGCDRDWIRRGPRCDCGLIAKTSGLTTGIPSKQRAAVYCRRGGVRSVVV